MILIQEADELAYRCSFACQRQGYVVKTKRGDHDFKNKYTKTDIVNFFKKKKKLLDIHYSLVPYQLIEGEHIVKHTLDAMVNKLFKVEANREKVKEVRLYLSASDNFRYDVATIPGPKGLGYKAGRPPKPYWLQMCKTRLLQKYNAEIMDGLEADDALGLYAGEGRIISHIDKDMNSIEGWHYNHVTGEVYNVPKGLGEGNLGLIFFYKQLLTGDPTDNIPGCNNPKKGHFAKPPKISSDVALELLAGSQTEEQAFNVVVEMYKHTYGGKWQESLKEVADLVWILREPGVTGSKYLEQKGFI